MLFCAVHYDMTLTYGAVQKLNVCLLSDLMDLMNTEVIIHPRFH